MKASRIGRFEQSFMFHMIRDFFLLLLVVVAAELGLRYALVVWEFRHQEPERVNRAAQQLAADVKSIMLNSGGPTAAHTVYPILKRNYDDLGLDIAVLPSEVTIASMKASRNMEPRGLPARWPAGDHNEASATLVAEQFCLACHVQAQVGEVLGTVTVRSYLSHKEAVWWDEVRLTAGVLSVNIIVHSIVLFLLLKVRMEPLLSLRATVAALAKGVMDLSPRARVNSDDEFGELALDLNHFLDRIGAIVHDLDKVLGELVSVGGRLGSLNRRLEGQLDGMRDASLQRLSEGARRDLSTRVRVAQESGAFDVLARTLDEVLSSLRLPDPAGAPLRAQLARLRDSFHAVAQALDQSGLPGEASEAHSTAYLDLAQSLREMAMLEATMQTVAESGQQLLHRVKQGRQHPPTG